MSKLFLISEEEKFRILNLHESATKRQYLSEQEVYTVQQGDTLSKIASKYKVDINQLVKDNGITNSNLIRVGQRIKIPSDTTSTVVSNNGGQDYVVKPGDSLSKIARDNGVTVKQIATDNGITDVNSIRVGQRLRINSSNSNNDLNNDTRDKKQTSDSLSQNIDSKFKDKFKLDVLSATDSIPVCRAGQPECGQFVNDFSKKLEYVGNAWLAHDLDGVGNRVKSSYTSLSPQKVGKIFNIFQQIEMQDGPIKRNSGGQVENIKRLQQELIKPVHSFDLKVDDVVGIYYPGSPNHEIAFHEAGKPYFVRGEKGGWKKGETIQKGKGFGMNTHVGIVGAIKDGIPLIFHNIDGQVYSDPYNKLKGGGKITWIKRL